MKRAMTLEQERQALLEQIHASRAAYRRMLAQYDEPEQPDPKELAAQEREEKEVHARTSAMGMSSSFPRSQTMRWVLAHPYAASGIAAGVVALLVLAPSQMARQSTTRRALRNAESKLPSMDSLKRQWDAIAAHAPWSSRQDSLQPAVSRRNAGGAAVASLAGLASMLLRDPQRMRMAARLATQAMDWMRSKRASQASGVRRSRAPAQLRTRSGEVHELSHEQAARGYESSAGRGESGHGTARMTQL